MAQKIIIAIIIFLLVIIQISFLPNFFLSRATPNLILVILIYLTARKGMEQTLKLAIFGGIALDLMSFTPIGADVFSFMAAVLAVDYLAKRFLVTHQGWRFLIFVALIAAGTIINEIFFLFFIKTFFVLKKINNGAAMPFDAAFAYNIIYNIFLFIMLYWPFKKAEKILNLYAGRAELKTYAR